MSKNYHIQKKAESQALQVKKRQEEIHKEKN
jgi:hypothetical protein